MKKRLLIIPIVLFLVSCSEREVDAAKIQDRNGVFYVINEDTPFSGKAVVIHPNGQLSFENIYVNGKKEGLYRMWYQNGQLISESTYVNGVMEGVLREWHENGQLSSESTYVNGNLDGVVQDWYENGQLYAERTYMNGVMEGPVRVWDENGQLIGELNHTIVEEVE